MGWVLLEEGRVAWREEKGMEASKVVKLMKFWGCPRCYECPRRVGSQYFYGNLTFFGLCGVLARARRALSDLLDTKPRRRRVLESVVLVAVAVSFRCIISRTSYDTRFG